MRLASIALIVRTEGEGVSLVETLSDDQEISLLESSCQEGYADPLVRVYERRKLQKEEEEEFGNYVEDLLSQPFVRPEIREHGVQWLKSKIRIEQYQKTEAQAAKTIAEYAFKMYLQDRQMKDFSLAGASTLIRVRIFDLAEMTGKIPQSDAA